MRSLRVGLRPIALPVLLVIAAGAGTALAETATPKRPTLKLADSVLRVGDVARMGGRAPSGVASVGRRDGSDGDSSSAGTERRVRIEFRARGTGRWRTVRRVRPRRDGRYRTRRWARRSGVYRAVTPDGRSSAREALRVRVRIRGRAPGVAISGDSQRISGRVLPGTPGRSVTVRVGDKRLHDRTDGHGRFSVRWRPDGPGTDRVAVVARRDEHANASRRRFGRIRTFRHAYASYYGPGFYGNRTACGQTLTPSTLGVAHRTMPCGTPLVLRNGDRQVRVRVIDRGPYAHGREFDLTEATKRRLGFGSTGWILSSR